MYNLIEMTDGKFEVIAHGLSFVEACNQAMFLETYEGGTFREVRAEITSTDAFNAWQHEASQGPFWPDWLD